MKIADSVENAMLYLRLGMGVCIAMDSGNYPNYPGVIRYTVEGEKSNILIAWHDTHETNPFIKKFVVFL